MHPCPPSGYAPARLDCSSRDEYRGVVNSKSSDTHLRESSLAKRQLLAALRVWNVNEYTRVLYKVR